MAPAITESSSRPHHACRCGAAPPVRRCRGGAPLRGLHTLRQVRRSGCNQVVEPLARGLDLQLRPIGQETTAALLKLDCCTSACSASHHAYSALLAMKCIESWSFSLMNVLAGWLPNAAQSVAALAVAFNLYGILLMG